MDNSSLLRLDPDEKLDLDEQDSLVFNFSLTLSITKMKLPTKSYDDKNFNDPTIIKNTAHIDLNDKNNTNARFIQVNQWPQIDSHLTAKLYVDNSIMRSVNGPTLLRLGFDEELKLDEQNSIILSSSHTFPETIIELPTKKHVDSLHEIIRNRRDLSSVYNDHENEPDIFILTILDSASIN